MYGVEWDYLLQESERHMLILVLAGTVFLAVYMPRLHQLDRMDAANDTAA